LLLLPCVMCVRSNSIFFFSSDFLLASVETSPQLVRKFPAFYGTRRFITALTSALHLSVSWARSSQSCLCRAKGSVQVWGHVKCFITSCKFLQWGAVSTSPNPQAGGPPHLGCPRLLIQYIRSYPATLLIMRLFLHLQPEDVPCRGNRDRLIMN
jgi:hypothetical protein